MPPAQRNKRFSLNAASKETAMVLSRPLDKGAAYAVSCSRILVVCVLLLSALFVGLLANDVTKDGQAENLQTRVSIKLQKNGVLMSNETTAI